jgi:hypothetical protein
MTSTKVSDWENKIKAFRVANGVPLEGKDPVRPTTAPVLSICLRLRQCKGVHRRSFVAAIPCSLTWLHAHARAHIMSICMMRRILDVHLSLADPR